MSIYKRTWEKKDGSKAVRYYFHKTIDGVRYRELIKTARTKADAERAANKIIAQLHEGKYGKAKKNYTLKDFAETIYLPWSREHKRSWKDDEFRIKPLLAYFGKRKLRDLNSFEIETYKVKRKNTPIVSKHRDASKRITKPRSPASVNREILLLSAILTLAIEKGEVSENPCREVTLYPEKNRERYLKPDEEERLMPVLTGSREHLRKMVVLAINTGLRESEIFKLKPQQIDFFRDVIHVIETKTDEDRQVPMNDTTRSLLRDAVAEAKRNDWPYLFINPKTGTRYTSIKTSWATACKLAGITNLRFHDLRHTFGTRAADESVPLTAIAKVMGHGSTKTTEKYAHATDAGTRRAVEALAKKSEPVTKWTQSPKMALAK